MHANFDSACNISVFAAEWFCETMSVHHSLIARKHSSVIAYDDVLHVYHGSLRSMLTQNVKIMIVHLFSDVHNVC